ncbi:hypothetical protein VTO42DRAFT_6555 [Malbranchea cinnamomea]
MDNLKGESPASTRRFATIPSGTPLGDEVHDPNDLPPGYTATSDVSHSPRQPLRSTPGLPPLNFTRYQIAEATLSKDKTTITVTQPDLSTNPVRLAKFITEQAALPPKPEIRIMGIRDSVYGENKVDFDIRINMLRYILRPPSSQPWNYMKIVGGVDGRNGGNGGLGAWAKQFCNDNAAKKTFVLTREVANWNTTLLDGRLRTLIASLRYQGRVKISFSSTYAHVVVLCPQNANSPLYSRVLSLVQEPKKYDVVRSVWPYANMPEEDDVDGSRTRECAVQNEREWWEDWKVCIGRAVVSRHKGWLTLDDLIDTAMGVDGMREIKVDRDWGKDF